MDNELTILNKKEEEMLKHTLFDFVIRVADSSNNRLPEEIQALPAVAKVILEHFVLHV